MCRCALCRALRRRIEGSRILLASLGTWFGRNASDQTHVRPVTFRQAANWPDVGITNSSVTEPSGNLDANLTGAAAADLAATAKRSDLDGLK